MPDEKRDTGIVIVSEGGDRFTNYSWDPGGPTRFGISKAAHPNEDIEHLTLERAEVIYHGEYVVPLGYPAQADPLALHLLSAGVNLGVAGGLAVLRAPARTFDANIEAFDWAWLTRYRDITRRNLAKVKTSGRPAADVLRDQRDQYAKLYGWLNRILNIRRDS